MPNKEAHQPSEQEVEFVSWKRHPVTKQLFKKLSGEREALVDAIVWGRLDNDLTVKGVIQTIDNLLNVSFEELYDI